MEEKGKVQAATIHKILSNIKAHLTINNWLQLKESSITELLNNGFEHVDYLEMCDMESLEILNNAPENNEVIILIAAFIENIRLIDNIKTSANILTN